MATSASQPKAAVLRGRALQPAIRSTSGRRSGLPRCRRVLSLPRPVSGNTELCDWRMVTSPGSYADCRVLALARELALAGEGIVLSEQPVVRPARTARTLTRQHGADERAEGAGAC